MAVRISEVEGTGVIFCMNLKFCVIESARIKSFIQITRDLFVV
jgi:hypothetical protein